MRDYIRNNSLGGDKALYSDEVFDSIYSTLESTKKSVSYEIKEDDKFSDYVLPLRIGWEELENWFPEANTEALGVVKGSSSAIDAIKKLSKHVKAVPFHPIDNRTYKPLDIQKRREGTCSEHSFLYVALARSVGIPSRLAVTQGENHVWAESWDGARWIHVDPSEDQVDYPEFYEEVWKRDISFVYSPRFDGKIDQLTKMYTEVGQIELPPSDRVLVYNKWWSTKEAKGKFKNVYDSLLSVEASGAGMLELGDGTYDISVSQGRLTFAVNNFVLKPGEKKKLVIN